MNSKGKGILAALGAGAIGIVSLFLFGKMKNQQQQPEQEELPGLGSVGGYEIGIDFDDGHTGNIGAGTSVILPDLTPDPTTVHPEPDGNSNDIYGMTSSVDGNKAVTGTTYIPIEQNTSWDFNDSADPDYYYYGNPADWYMVRDSTGTNSTWKIKNVVTGREFSGTIGEGIKEDYANKYGNPNSKFYREGMADSILHAMTTDKSYKEASASAAGRMTKTTLSQITNTADIGEPAGSSSGSSADIGAIATVEQVPELPAAINNKTTSVKTQPKPKAAKTMEEIVQEARKTAANINEYRRGRRH